MKVPFFKYHGAGNDFILLDDRDGQLPPLNVEAVAAWCARHTGIGADGLMLLQLQDGYDFKMKYYNSDGREGSMCGNGGRCIVAFANSLGMLKGAQTRFIAVDGPHEAVVSSSDFIELKMGDVAAPASIPEGYFANTGSPHALLFREDLDKVDVFREGRALRYSPPWKDAGVNVNFVQIIDNDTLCVYTYERGVEDETLSCGTGVTAAAIAFHASGRSVSNNITIHTKGGVLNVRFEPQPDGTYQNVWLSGPAVFVFQGETTLLAL